MTKKCLVIGASSFIGVYVVDALLDAGYEVVGTGRNRRFAGHYRKLGVEYIPLDLNDPSGTGASPPTSTSSPIWRGGCLQTRPSTSPLRTTPLNISGRTPWEPPCYSSGRARTACAASFPPLPTQTSRTAGALRSPCARTGRGTLGWTATTPPTLSRRMPPRTCFSTTTSSTA